MSDRQLGESAAFLLRRLVRAVYAASLLSVLLVTSLLLYVLRAAVIALVTLVSALLRFLAHISGVTALSRANARRRIRRREFRKVRRRGRRRRTGKGARSEQPARAATGEPTASRARPFDVARTRVSTLFEHSLPAVTAGVLIALRHAAQNERHDIGRFRDTFVRATYKVPLDDGASPPALTLLRDPATWRDLAYWSSTIVLSVVTAPVVTASWLLAPVVITVMLIEQGAPSAPPGQPSVTVWSTLLDELLIVVVTLVVALLAPSVTRTAAAAHAALGVGLLGPGEQARLQAEVAEQRLRRRLTLEAAEAERRRIERDLHDGAQQRLVSLAMNLGRARQKFATDPAGAERLVAEAHTEAKQALGELRTLARGIHPAVLTDRGLDAALSALAQRVGVPVEVDIKLSRRPPTEVESVAYFVVAEALTNVTRHAAATSVAVTVTEADGHVVVEITDDGVGGADPTMGTGLTGLGGRVESIDGRLEVDSPPGGPTTVRAELPCAS